MRQTFLRIATYCFLICFTLSSAAQVKRIFRGNKTTLPNKIYTYDNSLYVIIDGLVYSVDLDKIDNLAWWQFFPSPIFWSHFPYNVKDLIVSGDNIIVLTKSKVLLRSEDSGETWSRICPEARNFQRGGINTPNEFFFVVGNTIVHTSDFGKTLNKKRIAVGTLNIHPCDSKTMIAYYETAFDVITNKVCEISYDYGENWEPMYSGYMKINDVAYHYSNPNIIVVSAYPTVVSKDYGKTWNITNESPRCINLSFDTRGSDRLYGNGGEKLMYSDDFGSNWIELCQVCEDSSDCIVDFVQNGNKIYIVTRKNNVYQIDLSLLETDVKTSHNPRDESRSKHSEKRN